MHRPRDNETYRRLFLLANRRTICRVYLCNEANRARRGKRGRANKEATLRMYHYMRLCDHLACPGCYQVDHIQKVSAAYNTGRSVGGAAGLAQPVSDRTLRPTITTVIGLRTSNRTYLGMMTPYGHDA